MSFQRWQVGLDIQDSSIRALALQRRRQGWQLRHWWEARLPPGILHNGGLLQPIALSARLADWRKRLPRTISLRVAFPVQRVLQQRIRAPDQRLREPARSGFIAASAAREFPLDSQSLTLDYRGSGSDDAALLLTAARRAELDGWQHCLASAGLYPQVIDIIPCALRRMAQAAGVPGSALLVHHLNDAWLWVSPVNQAFYYGLLPDETLREPTSLAQSLAELCVQFEVQVCAIACSGTNPLTLPVEVLCWSPLAALRYVQPPLPTSPAAFTLAGGLALRPDDD